MGKVGFGAEQRRAVDINVVSALDALKEEGIDEDIMTSLAKSAGSSLAKDEVPVFRDGKMYAVKFEDSEVTRVLKGYDQTTMRTAIKVIGKVTSIPRNFQTKYNPLFPIRNLFYDMVQQAVTNPDILGRPLKASRPLDVVRPLAGVYEGLGHMVGSPEKFEKWAASGGAEHVFTIISKDEFIKDVLNGLEEHSLAANMWNAVRKPLDGLTAWTSMVSEPLRFNRYVAGIEQGETPLRAAVASSETATPRAAYGGPVGKAWNYLVPYTNAYLNGMEKTVRALMGHTAERITGNPNRTITDVEYSTRQFFAKGAMIITLPVIAQWLYYKDEEWYKAMPDWQKNNAWFVVPPNGDIPAIPVAAPPLIATIFVTIPRMLLERFGADNPHAFDNWKSSIGASLLPPNWVTGASILTPLVEHVSNYSFFRGQPLVSPDMVRGVQPAEQFTQYSSPAAKELARFVSDLPLTHSDLGWSPIAIDNYIAQWSGPMGQTAADAAAAALDRPSNPPPERRVSDWPGIRSWLVRYPSANAAPIQKFQDRMTQLDQMYGSLRKQIRVGDFEGFKRIVDRGGPSAAAWQQLNLGDDEPPGVDLEPYYNYLEQKAVGADNENIELAHQAKEALKNARDYSWNVYEDRNKTGHDKRQILDMTNALMQNMAERGNEALDRALVGVKSRGAAAKAPVPDSITFDESELAQ